MTKYKLKKDLPFYDKGTVIDEAYRNSETQECRIRIGAHDILMPYNGLFDWIEEVKPREFFIEITPDNYLVGVNDASGCKFLPTPYSPIKTKTIKVREVLE